MKLTWFDLNRVGAFGVWKSIVTSMVTRVLDSTIGTRGKGTRYIGESELLFDKSWFGFSRVVLYDVGLESREQVESSDQSFGLCRLPGLDS